ncbi:MAG: recombination mediator RecR [Thermodesulfobacteriota bacterium]|nr:recombination mediator RecR [Thermodesulfobacteriota bacterium]MEE2975585.1 recombination mediator RecR [Thermodesulfobacteriota bacterium]|tara:strand:- start:4651 stop:5256 length:606 start_codon:yes stop_codon:yes gene_type:complete
MKKKLLGNEITRLIESLSKLPGIGPITASRLALFLMKNPSQLSMEIARSIVEARKSVKICPTCNDFMFNNDCTCKDETRNNKILCIVENTMDLISIEKSQEYSGRYYVLQELLSISQGTNPKDLNIQKLIKRIEQGKFEEIILATDPTSDGEFTAQFIYEKIRGHCKLITRIAIGVPIGSEVNYIDKNTLAKSLLDRKKVS